MKPTCPKCGYNSIIAYSQVYVVRDVEDVDPGELDAPTLGGRYTQWETEQASSPQFACPSCGYESDDIENFLEGERQ
ncbi:MAG: hypothetical protein ABIH46_13965 [Chloroflexota bacterium]